MVFDSELLVYFCSDFSRDSSIRARTSNSVVVVLFEPQPLDFGGVVGKRGIGTIPFISGVFGTVVSIIEVKKVTESLRGSVVYDLNPPPVFGHMVVDSELWVLDVVVGTPAILVDDPIAAIVVVASKWCVVCVVAGHTPEKFDGTLVTLEALGVRSFAFPFKEGRVSGSVVPFFVFRVIGSFGRRSGVLQCVVVASGEERDRDPRCVRSRSVRVPLAL